MNKNEAKEEVQALSKGITHDAAQLLELVGTGAIQLPIKGTDQYVVAGTLEMIGKVLPGGARLLANAGAPAKPQAELSKRRIEQIGYSMRIQAFESAVYRAEQGSSMTGPEQDEFNTMVAFARAIEAEVAKAAPAAPVQAAAQLSLPNGWKIDRGGDDLRIRAKDGMWCGYRLEDENPARRLMYAFLADLHSALTLALPVQAEQAQVEPMVTRLSAQQAIAHVERSNAPGRAAEARAMLEAAPALPTQAEQAAAVRAATDEQSNVLPPFAAPAGQHDAGNEVLSYPEVVQILVSYGAFEESQWGPGNPLQYHTGKPGAIALVRTVEAEVVRRFRAQGGNTSTESSNIATKEAAAQVPAAELRDAARYRVLRLHVAPRDVSISMTVPWQDIPPNQSVEERIDMLCDIEVNREALAAAPSTTTSNDTSALGGTGGDRE